MTALLLALALLLCLPACGGADPVCGRYLCVGAEAEGIQMPAALLGEETTVLSLTADGRGTLTRGGAQGSLSWSREGDLLRLDVGGKLYDATLRDGLLLLQLEPGLSLRFAPEDAAPETMAEPESLDWYGWWSVQGSTGTLPDSWRDCCACLTTDDFGAELRLWDEESSREEPLALVRLRWEDGLIVSQSGWFLSSEIGEGEWRLDPAAEETVLSGVAQAGDERFSYEIRLRPWGARWEKSGGRLPFRYEDWYLPLIEDGAAMPDQIG